MTMIILYSLILFLLSVYSYSLVDVNLTLVNSRYWEWFRNLMVSFGYFQRDQSGAVYIAFVIILFAFYLFFVKKYKEIPILKLSILIGAILLFSYPFLTHDFFNYIFDAKILTFYHKIPYFFRAQDFPSDPWLRFLHWTHRKYPYGPTFLLLTAIPSLLAFNKFILNFFFFKLLFISSYVLSVYFLNKLNKKWAVIFATHPLIIIEGLVNSHNDFIGVAIALIGVYFLWQQKNLLAQFLFLISTGIKFVTAPLILITRQKTKINWLIFLVFIAGMLYLSLTREIQPWYFLNFFIFLPFFSQEIYQFDFFAAGLLFSSYLYVRFGVLNEAWQLSMKTTVIFIIFMLNAAYVFMKYFIWQKPSKKAKFILAAILSVTTVISRFYLISKTAVWGAAQLQSLPTFFYTYIKDPWLLTAIVPFLFVVSVCLIFLINIDFWIKIFYLAFLITAPPILFYSRFLSQTSLILVSSLILFHALLIFIFGRKKLLFKSWFKNNFWSYPVLALVLIFFTATLIKYFSSPTSIFSLETQTALANVVNYTENKEYIDNKNRPPVKLDKVRITIYPASDDIKGLAYILKTRHRLNISDKEGRKYIICYLNACSMKRQIIDYKLFVDDLRLPTGEKFNAYEIVPIYEIEGKLIVIQVR